MYLTPLGEILKIGYFIGCNGNDVVGVISAGVPTFVTVGLKSLNFSKFKTTLDFFIYILVKDISFRKRNYRKLWGRRGTKFPALLANSCLAVCGVDFNQCVIQTNKGNRC